MSHTPESAAAPALAAPANPETSVAGRTGVLVSGDLFASVLSGDCLQVMATLEAGSIDAIITDLPYGTTACKWDSVIPFHPLWEQVRRVLKPNGAFVTTTTQPFTSALVMSNPTQFKHEWIWHKSKSGSAFTAKVRPMAKHESVLVFGRGKITYNPQMKQGEPYSRTRRPPPINNHGLGLGRNGDSTTVNTGTRYPDSVIFFQQKWRRQDQLHPTQKPVELMRYLVRTYTKTGDTVLDPCCGSGTTGVAAQAEGRNCVLIEREEKYLEITRQRLLANASGQPRPSKT